MKIDGTAPGRAERFAILVPLRNRERYLEIFLREVPKYIEQVNRISDYAIYVAEQTSSDLFNVALSRNVAARAALEDGGFDYFVFHDVDTIPVRHVDYGPRPFNVAWFLTAGSCKIRVPDFIAANGYNPRFRGWGDEDVEFYHRLGHVGGEVREWHRIAESRRAVAINLEWPEMSEAQALVWSKSYFGHQGDGPLFVTYPSTDDRDRLARYDKSDFMVAEQQLRNHALWNRVRALTAAQKSAYIHDNGLNEMRWGSVTRERRDGVCWIRYGTTDVIGQPGATKDD